MASFATTEGARQVKRGGYQYSNNVFATTPAQQHNLIQEPTHHHHNTTRPRGKAKVGHDESLHRSQHGFDHPEGTRMPSRGEYNVPAPNLHAEEDRVGQYKQSQERGRSHIDYRQHRNFSSETSYESLQGTDALNPALVPARPEPIVTSYSSHPAPENAGPAAGAGGARGPQPAAITHHEPAKASRYSPGIDRHHGSKARVGSPVKGDDPHEFAYAVKGVTASIPTAGTFRGHGSNPAEGGRPTDFWQSQFEIDKGMGGDHQHDQKRTDPFTKAQQQKYGVSFHEKMQNRPMQQGADIQKPNFSRTGMDHNHTGAATAEEAGGSSGTAHWPTAGMVTGGNAPMYLKYNSSAVNMDHGHGDDTETLATGRVIPTAGHHDTLANRNDGSEQLARTKAVLANGGTIPHAGKEGNNYHPQHVRYASHWGVDHGHGDHMQESTSSSQSKWMDHHEEHEHAPPLTTFVPDGHLHSGPAPEAGVQKTYPTAGIQVGGNQPQYLRYASSWDVGHGHGNNYESAAKSTHQYQHDEELHAHGALPKSQGTYMHPAKSPFEHVQEGREKAERAAEMNRASAVRLSHNHDNFDVRQQSSYSASHAASHVGHHQHVHTHSSHATGRRQSDFRPHAAPGIPGSGY